MQIESVPVLPLSSGYENIFAAMNVLSRDLFADPTSSQSAETIAIVICNIMSKHAFSAMTIIPDKRQAILSQMFKEVAHVL